MYTVYNYINAWIDDWIMYGLGKYGLTIGSYVIIHGLGNEASTLGETWVAIGLRNKTTKHGTMVGFDRDISRIQSYILFFNHL